MNDNYESDWKISDLAWTLYEIRKVTVNAQRHIIENQYDKAIKQLDQVCGIVNKWGNDAEIKHAWAQLKEAGRRAEDMKAGKNILSEEEFNEKLKRLGEDLDDPGEDVVSEGDE